MSIDSCLIRITALELKTLQEQPDSLSLFVESLEDYSALLDRKHDDPINRVLYVDEFTLSLLTDMYPLETPFAPLNRALRLGSHILDGAEYGMGIVLLHTGAEVKAISDELSRFPEQDLRARFEEHAADFRLAATGYLESDEAILQYQAVHFRRLVTFFQAAAHQDDAMLVLVM